MLTAGFRWAPDTLPMNRMIAMTIRAGATTAAWRLISPGKAWPIIPPAGGHQHEEERAEQFRTEAAPLLARVVEIVNAVDDALLVTGERALRGCCLSRCH